MTQFTKWQYLWWFIAIVILLLVPFFLGKYTIFLLSLLAIYALVALGLNLLMGYTGQIAAGHAGFLALGAYFTAIIGENLQWLPCPVILLLAGIAFSSLSLRAQAESKPNFVIIFADDLG